MPVAALLLADDLLVRHPIERDRAPFAHVTGGSVPGVPGAAKEALCAGLRRDIPEEVVAARAGSEQAKPAAFVFPSRVQVQTCDHDLRPATGMDAGPLALDRPRTVTIGLRAEAARPPTTVNSTLCSTKSLSAVSKSMRALGGGTAPFLEEVKHTRELPQTLFDGELQVLPEKGSVHIFLVGLNDRIARERSLKSHRLSL